MSARKPVTRAEWIKHRVVGDKADELSDEAIILIGDVGGREDEKMGNQKQLENPEQRESNLKLMLWKNLFGCWAKNSRQAKAKAGDNLDLQ